MKYLSLIMLGLWCHGFAQINLEGEIALQNRIHSIIMQKDKKPRPGVVFTGNRVAISGAKSPELISNVDKFLFFFSDMSSLRRNKGELMPLFFKKLGERGLADEDLALLNELLGASKPIEEYFSKEVEAFAEIRLSDIREHRLPDLKVDLDKVTADLMFEVADFSRNLRTEWALQNMSLFSKHGQLILSSFIDEFFTPGITVSYLRSISHEQLRRQKELLFPGSKEEDLGVSEKVRQWTKSGVNLRFSLAGVWCLCEDPTSTQGLSSYGTFMVGGSTVIENPDIQAYLYTSSILNINATGLLTTAATRVNGQSRYTKAEAQFQTQVSPGLAQVNGNHKGFEVEKTTFVPIQGEAPIEAFSSNACAIVAYTPPSGDNCDRQGPGGLEKTFIDWEECSESPLVVDLNRDGFEFSLPGQGVYFDILGNNDPHHLQWLKPNGMDAFLVLDLNENGVIDNGKELFGEGTELILERGETAANGYIALAQYDQAELGGNEDGFLGVEDAIWKSLQFWNDLNSNGFSELEEIRPLSDYGQPRFQLTFKKSRTIDPAGNVLRYWSWVRDDFSKRKTKMVDVFFRRID